MAYDPVVSLRSINNERLRRSLGWAAYRDLGGALACTSDAPMPDSNRLESFTSDERRIDGLLEVGFALLRAFDCAPAVCVTPLDRPASLTEHLQRRGLRVEERSVSMVFHGDAGAIRINPAVQVRRAGPDDAMAWRDLAAGSRPWMRRLVLAGTHEAMQHPGSTFFIGSIDGQPAGTVQLLVDSGTAGIYAVSTLKSQRRRGVCSTLMAAAVREAQAQKCDVITLRTAAAGDARKLFTALGFEAAHENVLWVMPPRD
jgi:ribosomal protein S18 acetylase RimI-like enzyme